MSEPTRLHVKRRRTEEGPDYLVLEGTLKDTSQIRYVKKQRQQDRKAGEEEEEARFSDPHNKHVKPAVSQRKASRRVFHLQASQARVTGKRKATEEKVATFVEQKKRSRVHGDAEGRKYVADARSAVPQSVDDGTIVAPVERYKRPGKGSALRNVRKEDTEQQEETDEERKKKQELADYMQRTALEVAEDEESRSKPTASVMPKLSTERARQLHERRIASNGSLTTPVTDIEMESDDDFEYDTYVLAPSNPADQTMDIDPLPASADVGYLIISEADQELWETFLSDTPNNEDREFMTDDEDENAEDYYGADYPEDEIDTDDEFDRNPYGYRGVEEEWDVDEGSWSEDEYERMMDPFRNMRNGGPGSTRLGGGEDDNSD